MRASSIKSMGPFLSSLCLGFLLFCSVMTVHAEEIEIKFSESELPSETVFPVVDFPDAVIHRSLSFEKRFEARVMGGWFLDDPFYSNQYFGGTLLYHSSEIHSFGIRYQKWTGGLSTYSKQLDSPEGNSLRLERAPGPDSAYSLVYENQAYYGKISVGQAAVVPLTFSILGELGAIKYGSKNYPSMAAGMSQRFYFGQHFGVNVDLRLLLHQSLNPVSTDKIQAVNDPPSESEFSTRTEFSTQMDLGVLYLF